MYQSVPCIFKYRLEGKFLNCELGRKLKRFFQGLYENEVTCPICLYFKEVELLFVVSTHCSFQN